MDPSSSDDSMVSMVSFASFLKKAPLKVMICTRESIYHVHDQILRDHSKYFSGFLSCENVKDCKIILDHPGDTVEGFEAFIQHAYAGEYCIPNDMTLGQRILLVAKIYVMALRLQADGLKDEALGDLGHLMEKYGATSITNEGGFFSIQALCEVVAFIYGHTASTDPAGKKDLFRQIMVNVCAKYQKDLMEYALFQKILHVYIEFTLDLLNADSKQRSTSSWPVMIEAGSGSETETDPEPELARSRSKTSGPVIKEEEPTPV